MTAGLEHAPVVGELEQVLLAVPGAAVGQRHGVAPGRGPECGGGRVVVPAVEDVVGLDVGRVVPAVAVVQQDVGFAGTGAVVVVGQAAADDDRCAGPHGAEGRADVDTFVAVEVAQVDVAGQVQRRPRVQDRGLEVDTGIEQCL
jgi:hypothetical protein